MREYVTSPDLTKVRSLKVSMFTREKADASVAVDGEEGCVLAELVRMGSFVGN